MDIQGELERLEKMNSFLLQIIQSAKLKETMYLIAFNEQSLKPYDMLAAR